MSIKVSPNLPANVVEIGQELAQATLDGINNAASPSAGNPMITQSALSGQISGFITGIAWGDITGTITNQSDLTTYISGFGYITDAPSDGSEYVRKNATWAVATGGGGTWNGGAVTNTIYVNDPYLSTNSTEVGAGGIVVNTDTHSSIGIYSGEINGVETLRFSDNTSITTAPTGTTNFGDIFAIAIVKDVTWTGSSWTITCEPVNTYLANNGGMAVTNQDGSHFEWMSGMSTTSTWSYDTSTFYYNEDVYIQCLGQKSKYPINIQIV